MKRRTALWFALLTVVTAAPLAWSLQHLAFVRVRHDSAIRQLERTQRDAQEIVDLRSGEERIGLTQRPTRDVIAQVNGVLAQIGVPTKRMKSLVPEADTIVNGARNQGPQYRRQSLRLIVEDISASEIGSFLAAWNTQTIWTPTRIELSHSRSSGRSDHLNHYDLTVLMSTIYIAENS